jgi:hypothetical protein
LWEVIESLRDEQLKPLFGFLPRSRDAESLAYQLTMIREKRERETLLWRIKHAEAM